MSLLSHGLAVGLGYVLGRPAGRARLAEAGRQAADLARRPEVARLRQHGKDFAVDQAKSVKRKIAARSAAAAGAAGSDDSGPTGRRRRTLRTPTWRPRFSRSRAAHFPPSTDTVPPSTLGGTTVAEDSKAAMLGTPVTPRAESPAPPADRP
jgi:hypothetical protein